MYNIVLLILCIVVLHNYSATDFMHCDITVVGAPYKMFGVTANLVLVCLDFNFFTIFKTLIFKLFTKDRK